jgi:hypothetical protein
VDRQPVSGPATDRAGDEGSPTGQGIASASAAAAAEPAIPVSIDPRSPFLTTCPFFRSLDPELRAGAPIESPNAANRCAAFGEPKAQSGRQQELVCLTRAHTDCPRYRRGALVLRDGGKPAPAAAPGKTLSRAALAALILLAVSAGASFAFVVARGGLLLPGPVGSQVAAAATATPALDPTAAPLVTAPGSPRPTPSPPRSSSPTPSPTRRPTMAPTAAPTPAPTQRPTPRPTPRPTARPTSDRYVLLRPCRDSAGCWIYTVRSGDNLYSIANYFGHSLETVYRLNAWARSTPLRAGQQLVVPPPRR